MKRFFMLLTTVLLMVLMLPISAFAAMETQGTENIIYLDNGGYITVELSVTEYRASGTKSASKTYTYRGSDGVEEWRAVLRGTFSYTGSSATCTAASCDVTITDTDWYIVSKTATRSGASALGELTMGRKFLGITVDREPVSMRITCDINGNLS